MFNEKFNVAHGRTSVIKIKLLIKLSFSHLRKKNKQKNMQLDCKRLEGNSCRIQHC